MWITSGLRRRRETAAEVTARATTYIAPAITSAAARRVAGGAGMACPGARGPFSGGRRQARLDSLFDEGKAWAYRLAREDPRPWPGRGLRNMI